MTRQRGFTFTEFFILMLLAAIMAGITVPYFLRSKNRKEIARFHQVATNGLPLHVTRVTQSRSETTATLRDLQEDGKERDYHYTGPPSAISVDEVVVFRPTSQPWGSLDWLGEHEVGALVSSDSTFRVVRIEADRTTGPDNLKVWLEEVADAKPRVIVVCVKRGDTDDNAYAQLRIFDRVVYVKSGDDGNRRLTVEKSHPGVDPSKSRLVVLR